jgi:uncharacterized protein YbjT (DUF2867 family)
MINKEGKVILVTGATGHQGKEVVCSLIRNGWKVNALTRGRSYKAIDELKEMGADVVIGDMEDRSAIESAMKGAYGVFLITTPMEGGLTGELLRGKTAVETALAAGIQHLVFSSVGAADRKTGIPLFENKREIELRVKDSGITSTIFRPVSFMINFEVPERRDSILSGKFRTYYPEHKKEQYIALEDLGAFVNTAFENPEEYAGKEIELASDELTASQVADSFSMILGQRVAYEKIPLEEVRKQQGDDFYKMALWHMENSFVADISALRKIYPKLMTFDAWLRSHEWNRLRVYKAA